ncbi:MAG: hypothetical protein ABII90_02065 [Bacteroidota bacterium]
MKNLFAIFLLLIYFIAFLKPIYPFIEYAVNKDYIAKVLCINKDKPQMSCEGKCHLQKQLKKATTEKNNPEQNTPPKTKTQEVIFILKTEKPRCNYKIEEEKKYFSRNSMVSSQFFTKPPTPPPKSFHC